MSNDTHIKFDGVEGEATHKDHKGEIELLEWSWSVTNESQAATGGGSGKGKATPGAFKFKHLYDKASPNLAKSCASGKHFPSVKMTCRKAGEGQKDYLVMTMKEVLITSAKPSGVKDGDIFEEISCSYKEIEFAYKPQDEKGGLGGDIKFGWNMSTTTIT